MGLYHDIDNIPIFPVRPRTPEMIGTLVREFRTRRSWSQAQLATITKISEKTIQRVEAGRPSSLDTQRALARAFELGDLDFFNRPVPQATEGQLEMIRNTSLRVDQSIGAQNRGSAVLSLTPSPKLVKIEDGLQYDPNIHPNAEIGTRARINHHLSALWDSACLAGYSPEQGSSGGDMTIRRYFSGVLREEERLAHNEKLLELFAQIGFA
jgi:transcriptional regulator with XRE-family HTH domain